MLEETILTRKICGCTCEVVNSCGQILLYANGYFVGELWEEDNVEGYVAQAEAILG
jgi:hypothetical protein